MCVLGACRSVVDGGAWWGAILERYRRNRGRIGRVSAGLGKWSQSKECRE